MNKDSNNNGSVPENNSGKSRNRVILYVILAVVLIVGGYYGYKEYHYYTTHVQTEDAQTDGHIVPVRARVPGYIAAIFVNDNQHVSKGQLLAQIDTTDYALEVHMARSALSNARANLDVSKASLNQAKVSLDKAKLDYHRISVLYKGGATTRQKYDDVKAAFALAKAAYAEAAQKVDQAHVQIEGQKGHLESALLQMSYTHITAPESGVISKKNVEVGQLIQKGQPLMAVTNVNNVWITANFKETELDHIRVGQTVKISMDAYPDHTFTGRVESIAAATGSKYALLPPENATGNFVKVVQRVPVKIVFAGKDADKPMQLGLNVTVSIDYTQPVPGESTAAKLSE